MATVMFALCRALLSGSYSDHCSSLDQCCKAWLTWWLACRRGVCIRTEIPGSQKLPTLPTGWMGPPALYLTGDIEPASKAFSVPAIPPRKWSCELIIEGSRNELIEGNLGLRELEY